MRRLSALLALILLLASWPAAAASGRPWSAVRSWAVQLESLAPEQLAASPFDLLMVDYSVDGTDAGRLTPAIVQGLQRKPDGGRRLVVAYVNVGAAARHRFYWGPGFGPGEPPWVGEEVPGWEGLYRVRYWDPDWQAVLFGGEGAWLDQIMAAGFDGILVDPMDSTAWYESQGFGTARSDLVALVRAMADYARRGAGGRDFGVFVQNGEDLVNDPLFLRAVTGVVAQATWFGAEAPGQPTPPDDTAGLESLLRVARLSGALALNLDFTEDAAQIRQAHATGGQIGVLEYAAPPGLDRLQVVPGVQP